MSPVMDRGTNHCTVDVYDISSSLNGDPHGSPVDSGNWTLGVAGATTGMAEGLAACVSYRADYGPDVEYAPNARPRARDRNRHYFGPLTTQTLVMGSVSQRATMPHAVCTDFLNDTKQVEVILATGFGTPPFGPDQWNLQVWSRKNAATKPVAEYWMDDRIDYQRRRSDEPGFKYFLSA
jgi:hypothetical protein